MNGRIGECKACEEISEEGTDCEEPGVRIENLKVKDGYWRTTPTSTDVRSCKIDGACIGGLTSDIFKDFNCKKGYTGPYVGERSLARSEATNRSNTRRGPLGPFEHP